MAYVIKKVSGQGTLEDPMRIKYWTGSKWVSDTDYKIPAKGYKRRKNAEKVLVRERLIASPFEKIFISNY